MNADTDTLIDKGWGWHLADAQLVVRRWPGETECVVFSPLSGEVHLLNLAALALLDLLGRQPQSLGQLAQHLAVSPGESPDAEWSTAVRNALTTLDRAGLIEPREP